VSRNRPKTRKAARPLPGTTAALVVLHLADDGPQLKRDIKAHVGLSSDHAIEWVLAELKASAFVACDRHHWHVTPEGMALADELEPVEVAA
jgi:hypothetical protein